MSQVIKRNQRDYSFAFKLSVVEQVEKGEMSYKQAQARYGIQGRTTVLTWLRKHGQLDWTTRPSTTVRTSPMSEKTLPLTPEQRIKELEQQLAEMKIKAEFFEAVVDVLDRQYGASLVKKPFINCLKRKP